MKQVALDAKKLEERKSRKTLLVPPLVDLVVSSVSDFDTSCPTSSNGSIL